MCWLSWNLGAWTCWNPQGLSRPVMGLLYFYLNLKFVFHMINYCKVKVQSFVTISQHLCMNCLIMWYEQYIHSFIPLACAECNDSLPFSWASSIPLCYLLFPATLFHQLFFHPPSPHLAIYFLVYLSILLFPNSYIILFYEFYFLPFSVHAQTNIIYLTLLSLFIHSFI